MVEERHCPQCGGKLPADAPGELCPECLFKAAMANRSDSGVDHGEEGPALTTPYVAGLELMPKKEPVLLEAGQQFGGYRIVRRLGKGGMGVVYEAEHLESGRRVALKVLRDSLDSPDAQKRFLREGRLAASVNHPNSVYVFGTDEIEGVPVISMELVPGGTLEARVRQDGPLPVGEAVDTILQIIAGLEAAESVGVLHRDVKPGNCFVDADGTVKVGDFGLSISTSLRSESNLTTDGTFLGTPAFSSPEQLRGDELDLRSDIYAVGVTLYYLLTGRTPFEAKNLVQLLAKVLEQRAPLPTEFRKGIPGGLAKVVMRCLAKQPSDRFKSYAELRKALAPYDSTAPTPAALVRRCAAGVCDHFFWTFAVTAFQFAWFRDIAAMTDPALIRSAQYMWIMMGAVVLNVLYFAVPEGLWGASLGKKLFRLRVVDRNRSLIGVPRATLRAAIYVTFPGMVIWTYWILNGRVMLEFDPASSDPGSSAVMLLMGFSYYVMLALLFSTARRRNGYAGLHDLATGGRVILRSAYAGRPAFDVEEPPLPDTAGKVTIGPYDVLDTLHRTESQEFVLGYDARLLRRVWIRKLSPDSPPVSPERRNMGRVGRLRWINGRRTSDECWDAYEALSGEPLPSLLGRRQPWSMVRYWLLDLAQELNAASQDGTLPETLALDRVWITADGRAKLLDFPAPGTDAPADAGDVPAAGDRTVPPAQKFLLEVAASALQGRVGGEEPSRRDPVAVPLPVGARTSLDRIPTAPLAESLTDLKRLVKGTPAVLRWRRLGMLAATAFFPILMAILATVGFLMVGQWDKQQPEIGVLKNCLTYMEVSLRPADANNEKKEGERQLKREAFEVYIAGTFRPTITDPKSWNSLYARSIPASWRAKAERIVAERPEPSEEELRDAAAVVEPILEEYPSIADVRRVAPPAVVGLFEFVIMWLMFVTVPGMIAAVAFRRGLVMRLFGVDCVTGNGRQASRLRMLWRSVVFHSPVVLGTILAPLLFPLLHSMTLLPLLVALALALVICSSLLPERGLSDRLAGTYPVPR